MLKLRGPVQAALLLVAVLSSFGSLIWAQLPVVRFGVALDGPSEHNAQIVEVFEQEIAAVLEGEYQIVFSPKNRLEADWTAEGVKRVVDRLIADPEVDQLLTLGVLGSSDVGLRSSLPKPVFAPFVLDPQIQGIPFESLERHLPDGEIERVSVSGLANLSYVTLGGDLVRQVKALRDIAPFSRLTILQMRALSQAIPDLESRLESLLRPLGLEIATVAVGSSVDQALSAIPENTEAVFVSPLLELSSSGFDRLVKALIQRRLPSFSSWGRIEVEKGLLATLWSEQNHVRRARRLALNILQVLDGVLASELAVEFVRSERLTLNLATARAIGFSPTFRLLTEAELLHEESGQAVRTLSLPQVVRQAGQVNLDLLVEDRNVASGLQLVRQARARLFPQLNVSGSGSIIDEDRADQLLGLNPQRRAAAGASFTQLLYSDDVKASYDIERHLQDLRTEERAQLRLDVILEAAESYLNVLRAKTIERVQKDNLRLTRSNLELAQARVNIGQAGREELFRWQSQMATNRRDVVEASALRNQAEIAVNRVLNRPIEESFLTVEAGLDDPLLVTAFEQTRPYIETPDAFQLFRSFMVQEGFGYSPELRQLDAAMLAQTRELKASKRAFYLPTLGLGANVEYFGRGGVGADPLLQSPVPFADQTNWNIFFNTKLPLFQGGAMRARRSRAQIELEAVTLRRQATSQRIEQRIRSVLYRTGSSFVGIDLSQEAAEAARRNLELVTDRYAEGIVDIVRLIDAQNQVLVADLSAANAIFDYLIDLMGTQRAVGRFDYFQSPQERQGFLNRLEAFFQSSGYKIRTP